MAESVKNSDIFKPDDVTTEGHNLGYVSIKDITRQSLPGNAVIGCRNLDFYKGYDEVRQPYDLYKDLVSVLPSGYILKRFCEKQFVDADGNKQKVLIAAAKGIHPSSALKLFISNYYSPEDGYDNCYKPGGTNQHGWTPDSDGFYELTERYFDGEDNVQFLDEDITIMGVKYNLKIINRSDLFANKPINWFKGFYVIGETTPSSNTTRGTVRVIGSVTNSFVQTIGGNYVAIHFAINIEANTDVNGGISDGTGYRGICRFPVDDFNKLNWSTIQDIRFETSFPNAVRMYYGSPSRHIYLGFISKKKYFQGGGISGVQYSPAGRPTNWLTPSGHYSGTTATSYEVKCTYTQDAGFGQRSLGFSWREGSGAFQTLFFGHFTAGTLFDKTYPLNKNISVRITASGPELFKTGDDAVFTISFTSTNPSWNGFWMRFDPPYVPNKKKYLLEVAGRNTVHNIIGPDEIGNELGIHYELSIPPLVTRKDNVVTDKIYSLAVELDGYQTIFVKQLATKPLVDNVTPANNRDCYLNISVIFEPWFDRSISAHMLYYFEDQHGLAESAGIVGLSPSNDDESLELVETLRLSEIMGGYIAVEDMAIAPNSPISKVDLIEYAGEDLIKNATGELLSAQRLNNKYWKSVIQKSKFAVRVGDNIVSINLDNATVNIDKENFKSAVSNGDELICISQSQAGVNAESILCTERIQPVMRGSELRGGAWMTENQFLIFSEKEVIWYDLTDEATDKIRTVGIFDEIGLVNPDAIVTAREIPVSQAGPLTTPLSSKFKGTFFAGPLSIYGFYDNHPVNLLQEEDETGNVTFRRWQREYQGIQDKSSIRFGYRASTKDVYVWIPEFNEIRIWNIPGQHWKKYIFPDQSLILNFVAEKDGELYFNTATKIYKTEPQNTTKSDDKESEIPVPFDINLKKIVNWGNSQTMKVLDSVEISYDAPSSEPMNLNIKVGTLDNNGDVLDANVDLQKHKFYWKQGYGMSRRAQWSTVEITSTPDTSHNFKGFRLLMTKLRGLLTAGNFTRE